MLITGAAAENVYMLCTTLKLWVEPYGLDRLSENYLHSTYSEHETCYVLPRGPPEAGFLFMRLPKNFASVSVSTWGAGSACVSSSKASSSGDCP